MKFCRDNNILCQGRGSAANSAVCYALRITNVDAVKWDMLFERFLAPERDGPPDIDVDIESDRREEVIQYVYGKYGRRHTAQVANVISYRPRSAVRDIAKAFGHSPGQQDAWSKQIDRWGSAWRTGRPSRRSRPEVVAYANELMTFPRHLGIHSGGMVICDRPVIEVCPVEWARMENRTVLQWDKDDCASAGLVKFDLLGLGMLSALHYALDFVDPHLDLGELDLADPEVYDMLCRADAVGVFQVESRAQMATLPRLRPREFYDLVVEVALIRPGPIQGGSVHPYIRRKQGKEPPTPPHPLLENALRRTLGVPLFQEQLMQMAIDVAGFDAAGADELRRAMGSKRSAERMDRLKERLYAGMADKGVTAELADDLFLKLSAFANYGFPESHAMSFAALVFASAWFKRYHPAAFCAALINAQPMGFYSTQSLADDARRHGVRIRRPDINASDAKATLEPPVEPGGPRSGPGLRPVAVGRRWAGGPARPQGGPHHRRRARRADPGRAGAGRAVPRPARPRPPHGRRRPGDRHQAADRGQPGGAGHGRRLRRPRPDPAGGAVGRRGRGPGAGRPSARARSSGYGRRCCPAWTRSRRWWPTSGPPGSRPTPIRSSSSASTSTAQGAVPIEQLYTVEDGRRVLVGGIVTHRQRPATAGGVTFLNLEDETGHAQRDLLRPGCGSGSARSPGPPTPC